MHEVDPPAETQRRRVLAHTSASPRLRARFSSKPIPTAADAMGGHRGACPRISAQGVLSARFSPHAAPPEFGPCRHSSRLGVFA